MELKRRISKAKIIWSERVVLMFAVLFVIAIWILSCLIVVNLNFEPGQATMWAMRGQFGDLFGAANSLFSGLAFAGIIFTIFLQRQELKAQRIELELTRNELELTRNEFEKQNTTLARQRFENTFFSMLTIHVGIVSSLDFKGEKGIRTFDPMMKLFIARIDSGWMTYEKSRPMFSAYKGFFQNSWPDHIKYFSQYLQSLAAMYNAIVGYSEKNEPRQQYFNIMKSYLSDQEKLFLFYYILFANDFSHTTDTLKHLERDLDLFSDPYYPKLDHSHKGFLDDPNRG